MLGRLFGGGSSRDDTWSTMSSLSGMLARMHSAGVAASARRHAGVIFSPDDSNPFLADLKSNLDDVLYVGPGATKTAVEIRDDEYGMRWVILDDGSFPDLLSSTYTVANAMRHNGGARNLLAATFHMDFATSMLASPPTGANAVVESYLIYRFDRNRYYPFVPEPQLEERRDADAEFQLGNAMRGHGLALDGERRQWLGLWDIPF